MIIAIILYLSIVTARMSSDTEPSLLGRSILQSTFSDGHFHRPDFDISVIKGKLI